jgi:hypothetical protein
MAQQVVERRACMRLAQIDGFFARIAIAHHHDAARFVIRAMADETKDMRVVEQVGLAPCA